MGTNQQCIHVEWKMLSSCVAVINCKLVCELHHASNYLTWPTCIQMLILEPGHRAGAQVQHSCISVLGDTLVISAALMVLNRHVIASNLGLLQHHCKYPELCFSMSAVKPSSNLLRRHSSMEESCFSVYRWFCYNTWSGCNAQNAWVAQWYMQHLWREGMVSRRDP